MVEFVLYQGVKGEIEKIDLEDLMQLYVLSLILDDVIGSCDEEGDDQDSEFDGVIKVRVYIINDMEEECYGDVVIEDQEVKGEEGVNVVNQVCYEVYDD